MRGGGGGGGGGGCREGPMSNRPRGVAEVRHRRAQYSNRGRPPASAATWYTTRAAAGSEEATDFLAAVSQPDATAGRIFLRARHGARGPRSRTGTGPSMHRKPASRNNDTCPARCRKSALPCTGVPEIGSLALRRYPSAAPARRRDVGFCRGWRTTGRARRRS